MGKILELFRSPVRISDVTPRLSQDTRSLIEDGLRLGMMVIRDDQDPPLRPSSTTKALYALGHGPRTMSQISARVTRKDHIDGSPFFVLDGLFEKSEVVKIDAFFRNHAYAMNRQSSYDDKTYLSAGTRLPIDLPMYARLEASARMFFPQLRLEARRAQGNVIRYGDYQAAHVDAPVFPKKRKEVIVTALYYANKRWDSAWQGETVLYDKREEPHSVIAPRPGRVLLSYGTDMHRSGVPSRLCQDPRMTVAVQFRTIPG